MNKSKAIGRISLASWVVCAGSAGIGSGAAAEPVPAPWPAAAWRVGTPSAVGLDERTLGELDRDLAAGKYGIIDSVEIFRCGEEVFKRRYPHDYASIYGKEAATKGPLNARLTGRYNYFDPAWHPYFHGTDLHTMQSVSKTFTSAIIAIARTRGDFKAGLNMPVLHYFDVAKVKNVDERKRRMTLQDVLTMTTGLDWREDVPYDDPRSDASLMEANLSRRRRHRRRPVRVGVRSREARLSLFAWRHVEREAHHFRGLGEAIAHAPDRYRVAGTEVRIPMVAVPPRGRQAAGLAGNRLRRLMVFPDERLIATFTGWDILKDPAVDADLVERLLPSIRNARCSAD